MVNVEHTETNVTAMYTEKTSDNTNVVKSRKQDYRITYRKKSMCPHTGKVTSHVKLFSKIN